MIRKGEEDRPKLVAASRQVAKNVSNLGCQRCNSPFQEAEEIRILERVCRDALEAVFAPKCNAFLWRVLVPLGGRPLPLFAPLTTHGAHHGSSMGWSAMTGHPHLSRQLEPECYLRTVLKR